MVTLASLPYPIVTFVSYKAKKTPRKSTFHSSIRVSSAPSRRVKRKNYLRPKIRKTLNKPYPVPLSPLTSEDPCKSIEPTLEKSDSSFVKELEESFGSNEYGMGQLEVVGDSEVPNLVGIKGFSGRTVVTIIGSFVVLFVVQTIVAVWIMGSGESDENRKMGFESQPRDLRLGMQGGEAGLNGNAFLGNWALLSADESEMEAKIAEIRNMAREVREVERKKKLVNCKADVDGASDGDDDDEEEDDFETDSSRIRNGIVKEIDGRLTKFRKRSPTPLLNVDFLNIVGSLAKEGGDEGLDGKEVDNMLMFKKKNKFRSHLTARRDKPKGFHSVDAVREKYRSTGDELPVERTGSGDQMNLSDANWKVGIDSNFPEKRNIGLEKDVRKPQSQSSTPLHGSKNSGSSGVQKTLNTGINDSTSLGSNSATKELSKGMNKGAKPERGVVQDYSNGNTSFEGAEFRESNIIATQDSLRKMNDRSVSTSKTHAKLPFATDKEKQETGDLWWSALPYVFVILMQKGLDNKAQRGFYTIRIFSDVENQSYLSYTVAFEDRNDARNFSYLLDSAFEDLQDAAVDVAPLSTKELKEVTKSLNNKVIVIKKGELKLYAGQPLTDAETALKSLVK